MRDNPIRKRPSRSWFGLTPTQRGGFAPRRFWYYRCPICGTECQVPYAKNTRKMAEDMLFAHLRNNHAAPGLETATS